MTFKQNEIRQETSDVYWSHWKAFNKAIDEKVFSEWSNFSISEFFDPVLEKVFPTIVLDELDTWNNFRIYSNSMVFLNADLAKDFAIFLAQEDLHCNQTA